MRRSTRGWHVFLAFLVVLFVLAGAAVAWAAPEDLVTAIGITESEGAIPSSTPSPFLWVNELYPGVTFGTGGVVQGFLYSADRSPTTVLAMPGTPPPFVGFAPTPYPGASGVALYWTPGATNPLNPGLDMRGWLGHYTGPAYSEPGMVDPVEGRWFVHARAVTDTLAPDPPILGQMAHEEFHVDITPPATVRNLRFTASEPVKSFGGYPLLGRSRVDFYWDNLTYSGGSYDSLSKDSRWIVDSNFGSGKLILPVVARYPYGALSVENLMPVSSGLNTMTVQVQDYAGNISAATEIRLYSDGDLPTVNITRPAVGAAAGGSSYRFAASASDLATVTSVTFKIDGKTLYTDTTAPYSVTKSMAGYAHGSYHTLSATAKDLYGHTTTVRRTFRVDKVRPRLTMYGDSPDPFYPVLTDGYKDTTSIKFRIYERCTCTLQVFKSNGSLWRQSKSTKSAGYRSMTWDGRGSGGTVQTGTFYYRIGVTDVAGNTTWSAKYPTHIRNYELKRTSDGGIQVIAR